MHLEILVEDASGLTLLETLVPKILGEQGAPHTWRLLSYKGVGNIPKGLKATGDPAARILLDRLPALLRGYAKTPGVDALVVVLDSDRRDCKDLLAELHALQADCASQSTVLFRLAIEELEAWYFGDQQAILAAYPRAKQQIFRGYAQDSICGTWEFLAEALYPGGMKAVRKSGWPLPGQLKHEWARAIGPHMDIERNQSPSFGKLRDGLRRLVQSA